MPVFCAQNYEEGEIPYYLVETKAPDGYTVNAEPKNFQITAADAGKTLQIEVYDDKLVVLPVTGGEVSAIIVKKKAKQGKYHRILKQSFFSGSRRQF